MPRRRRPRMVPPVSPAGFLSRVLPAAFLVAAPLYYVQSGWGGAAVCVILAAVLAVFVRD